MWSYIVPVLFILKITSATVSPTPVVLWHGMGDACCMPYSLGAVMDYLTKVIPGIYINSIKIGDSIVEDLENGYLMNPNKQVKIVCKMLAADKNLSNGFNAVGFSQGSQFLRAVVQRCGHQLPPIRNLISLGGQHQGVYGLPHCAAVSFKSCDYIRKLLNYAAYESWLQRSLVQATYWHDPLHEELYKNNSIFLADINNERYINKTYVKNLNRLEKFVMVKYENDTIVQPRETEWFGFYVAGQSRKLIKLQDSKVYERLGLKKMDRDGKLVFISTQGDHLKMSWEWFSENIVDPFLKDKARMIKNNLLLKGRFTPKKDKQSFQDERFSKLFHDD